MELVIIGQNGKVVHATREVESTLIARGRIQGYTTLACKEGAAAAKASTRIWPVRYAADQALRNATQPTCKRCLAITA